MNLDKKEDVTGGGIEFNTLVLMEKVQRRNVEKSEGQADHHIQKKILDMIVEKINERAEEKYQGQKRSGEANQISDDEDDDDQDKISMSKEDEVTIRVTDLPKDIQEQDLWNLFTPFGPLSRVFLAKDETNNTSKGFASITFNNKKDAKNALRHGTGVFHGESFKTEETNKGQNQ